MIHTEEIKSSTFETKELTSRTNILQKGDSCYDNKKCQDCMTTFWLCTACVACCTNLLSCFNLANNLAG